MKFPEQAVVLFCGHTTQTSVTRLLSLNGMVNFTHLCVEFWRKRLLLFEYTASTHIEYYMFLLWNSIQIDDFE